MTEGITNITIDVKDIPKNAKYIGYDNSADPTVGIIFILAVIIVCIFLGFLVKRLINSIKK